MDLAAAAHAAGCTCRGCGRLTDILSLVAADPSAGLAAPPAQGGNRAPGLPRPRAQQQRGTGGPARWRA